MPQLDFMIVADFVRAEGAVLHMIAAGIDTIYTPVVPALHRLGVGIRLTMTPAEAQYHHQIEIILQTEDGERLAQVNGGFAPPGDVPELPPGVRPSIAIPFNMNIPLPAYGRYSLELLVDANSLKSIDLTVSPPPAGLASRPTITGHGPSESGETGRQIGHDP